MARSLAPVKASCTERSPDAGTTALNHTSMPTNAPQPGEPALCVAQSVLPSVIVQSVDTASGIAVQVELPSSHGSSFDGGGGAGAQEISSIPHMPPSISQGSANTRMR